MAKTSPQASKRMVNDGIASSIVVIIAMVAIAPTIMHITVHTTSLCVYSPLGVKPDAIVTTTTTHKKATKKRLSLIYNQYLVIHFFHGGGGGGDGEGDGEKGTYTVGDGEGDGEGMDGEGEGDGEGDGKRLLMGLTVHLLNSQLERRQGQSGIISSVTLS